jgi:hypothetical protein
MKHDVGRTVADRHVGARSAADKTLTSRKDGKTIDLGRQIDLAAGQAGVSRLRIALDILRRRFGRQRLAIHDYFDFGVYRPDLTEADREAFVSQDEITRLNRLLRPAEKRSMSGLVSSKFMTELLLRTVGLPCSRTLAIARSSRAQLPVPVLVGAAAIEAFLREGDRMPLFIKPDGSSLSIGAASILHRDGDDLVFGDGKRVPVARLSHEIARDYPNGFIFQRNLRPHPELARLIGPVVGTMRVVSLWLKEGPQTLYVAQKMPGPNAMVDGEVSGSTATCLVDPATGRIVRAHLAGQPIEQELTHNHVTGAPLAGTILPDFAAAIRLALEAHRLFPGHGVLGSDIVLTDEGPVINEVNLNPLVSLVQRAGGAGLLDARNKAMYREALAMQGVALPRRSVRF